MSHRILAVMLTLGVFPWLTPWPVASQPATTQDGDAGTSPRTPWGEPDLQGVWNFTLNTPLERPAEFGARAVLTEEEVAVRAQADAQLRFNQNNPAPVAEAGRSGRPRTIYDDGQGGTSSRAYNRFWVDLRRTSLQTSLVVDPPDGRIPPVTAEAEQWHAEQQMSSARHLDGRSDARRFCRGPWPSRAVHAVPPGVQLRAADGTEHVQQQRHDPPVSRAGSTAQRDGS